MKTPLNFIRQHVKDMPPYEPIIPLEVLSDELGIPVDAFVKLDGNENPYGPLPDVQDSLASLDAIHYYPDPENRRVRRSLAEYHQIPEENILIGAGADELIDLIMRIVIEPGDRLLNCPPTFGMYAFDGMLNQASVLMIPRKPDFSIELDQIEEAVQKHHPKLLFLANPNNPDGGIISRREFDRLLNLPLLLVIDEAYINFHGEEHSVIHKVEARRNLIVLRTFSKWAGLAGLRIGYGVFPTDLLPVLMKSKQPYNVSVAAEVAAVISLQNVDKLENHTAQIVEQRQELFSQLETLSWVDPYPSQANFILCRVKGISAGMVYQRLREKGILIRYFNKPSLRDHIRISVGTKDQIDVLMKALKGIGES